MSGAEHWEGVHRSKAADEVSWWQDPEDLWLDLIDDLDLPPDAPILDVGSGSSLLVDALGRPWLHARRGRGHLTGGTGTHRRAGG